MRRFRVALLVSSIVILGGTWCETQGRDIRSDEQVCEPPPDMQYAEAVTGPYPLQATVTHIDYHHSTVDFKTEIGTFLHVTRADFSDLTALQVGDVVTICIVEALHGDMVT